MSRSIVLLLLAQSLLAGCSFVYDPDDHVAVTDPCDLDGDGFRAATPTCGGDDCDDASSTRYPGAPPACDGATPNDCRASDLVAEVRTAFGAAAVTMVDFGQLPDFTYGALSAPSALTAPPPRVEMVGFESANRPQATVAFVAGSTSGSRDATVLLFGYDLIDPTLGTVEDPALAVPSAFAFGGITGSRARVLATQRNFAGAGPFLWYRDVETGADRPHVAQGGAATFGISTTNFIVRPTVGLAGAFDPIANAADNPQMMFVLRPGVAVGQDTWARLPWDSVDVAAMRYVTFAAGPLESTRIWPTAGGEAFALTENASAPWVWERSADAGDNLNVSGVVTQYSGVNITGTAVVEPVILPRATSAVPGAQEYQVFFVDAQGQLNVNTAACARTTPGTATGQSTCASVNLNTIAIPNIFVLAFDAARTPGDGTMFVITALDTVSNQRGVLVYYLPSGSTVALPFAHKDAMGRGWLVPPEADNGAYYERVALTVLDEPYGAAQRLTVAIAGISDYTLRDGASVTVTGVVACVP